MVRLVLDVRTTHGTPGFGIRRLRPSRRSTEGRRAPLHLPRSTREYSAKAGKAERPERRVHSFMASLPRSGNSSLDWIQLTARCLCTDHQLSALRSWPLTESPPAPRKSRRVTHAKSSRTLHPRRSGSVSRRHFSVAWMFSFCL